MLSLGRYVMFDVVFSRGSELTQLNFCGFYIVVLERDGEVVSVVTIRIFGKRVVEIPFVATKKQCRRQGMCDILMNEIEKLLTYLGVKEIVLPPSRDITANRETKLCNTSQKQGNVQLLLGTRNQSGEEITPFKQERAPREERI
ncbi:hypothetical protein JHK87_043142 [Glycine soja]|nr:hypothetical protein JHK87_043142 [Glycine soja]